jgi:subtilisin family serine protease
LPASGRKVYLIDSGVALHDDLPGVTTRVNMACGNNLVNCSTGTLTDQFPVVGCYPHATHVAGIIGARGSNGKTGAGIYDAVNMISVSVVSATGIAPDSRGKCSDSKPSAATIGYALDYVYRDVLGSVVGLQQTRAPIVNISINPGGFGFSQTGVAGTNRVALLKLVTPATAYVYNPNTSFPTPVNYVGAFVAQSAGNIIGGDPTAFAYGTGGKDICTEYGQGINFLPANQLQFAYTHAFPNNNTTSLTDGIMVVGAVHNDGPAADLAGVIPSRRFGVQYNSTGLTAQNDHSSNYGPCIDIWAPGNLIYSTWGTHTHPNKWNSVVGVTYSGSGVSNAITQGWNFLSGTSMAAPHVAGAAAYLADAFNLTTPAQIEQKVRQYATRVGYLDRSGREITIVQLP